MMKTSGNFLQHVVLECVPGGIFVNKPQGVSVHNHPGNDLCSLVQAGLLPLAGIGEKTGFDPGFGVHAVHRLDKETSGIMLLAVNQAAFRFFSRQFEDRTVVKHYVAILHGNLAHPEKDGIWGTWRWPLSKSAGGRKNPAGPARRLPCETRYRVQGHSRHYSMVRLSINTGRTHQIRRHAKLSGHPVAGDGRYGSTRAWNYLKNNMNFNRLALHARSLTMCTAPGTEPQTIETPEVPKAMTTLFSEDKVSVERVDPREAAISRMIADLDAYQASLYPPESNHLVDVEKLAGRDYFFIAAMEGGQPKAIASYKRMEKGYVEIKRLYVPEPYRGRKLAKRLMAALEKRAREEGFSEARLETGIHQHAAIRVYEKMGYHKTGPFGSYRQDPLSVFMQKKL